MDYFKHGVAGAGSAGEDYAEVLPRTNLPLLDLSIFPFIANPNSAEAGQDLYNGNISGMTTTLYDINPASAQFGNPIPMASFYRYDQMNRLKKVQSYDHISSNGLSWQAYTQDDRFQMQLSYDLNGNILNLKRNGNNAAQLVMDDLNYYYHYLDNGNTLQNGQLPVTGGNTMNVATNRLGRLTEPAAFSGNYTEDVDGLPVSGQANEVVYAYDAIGNLTRDLSEEIDEIKWNPYGKVTEVIRTTACQSKPDLLYEYDSFGQRIKKVVKPRAGGVLAPEHEWITHWYIRDAQGNVLAVYKQQSTEAFGVWHEQITLEEWDLYGSARLGTRTPESPLILANRTFELVNNQITNENIPSLAAASNKKFRKLGEKVFELVNHLGNIISTISDRKLMHEDLPNNPGVVHHYTAEILSVQEQFAFGMNMPGRSFSVEEYRYGFNGKENQDELMANNSSQDFGARMYDARVGRWWGMDYMKKYYPSRSPYEAMASNPIFYVDVDGKYFTGNCFLVSEVMDRLTMLQNKWPDKAHVYLEIKAAILEMAMDPDIEFHLIHGGQKSSDGKSGGSNTYNPEKKRIEITVFDQVKPDGREVTPRTLTTIHELCHGYQFLKLRISYTGAGKPAYHYNYSQDDENEAFSWANSCLKDYTEIFPWAEDYYDGLPKHDNVKPEFQDETNLLRDQYMKEAILTGDSNTIQKVPISGTTLRILIKSLPNIQPKERCPDY
jgi:RHS repeat-associated protein